MPATAVDFEVRRDDLSTTRILRTELRPPAEGEVLVEVERFGLSANNITYGRLGEELRYWDLFPASDGWGRIPVWAHLRVVASQVPGIEVGRRGYGLGPMSSHLYLQPERLHSGGFVDQSGRRSQLSAIYNAYTWLDTDPADRPEQANLLLVLRPVFWLSFLVADYLAEQGLLDASRVLITSASSRAAIGIAYLLSRRDVGTVGLTSTRNRAFVEALQLYDEVRTYDIPDPGLLTPTVLVDVAGDADLRERITGQYGAALTQVVVAGFTHGQSSTMEVPSPPAGTSLLFVPTRLVERARQLGWPKLNADYSDQVRQFAAAAGDWLRVDVGHGASRVEEVYRAVLDNTAASSTAHVLTIAATDR